MRIRIVDAFTDQPFAGNPAGVCLLEAGPWPADSRMLQIAAEVNLSETAFARPLPGDPDADWELRWFTPKVEAKMCGHATLATTHALSSDGLLAGPVRFNSLSGVLVASVEGETITLDFPASPPTEIAVPAGLSEALGVQPKETYRTEPLGDLLVVLADEATVRSATPDLNALAKLTEQHAFRGAILTARAEGQGEGGAAPEPGEPAAAAEAGAPAAYDFVSRFFAPAHGIPEDPVTGSAHTGLAPYWAGRLGREQLVGFQASARGGLVRVRLAGDRVHLTGHAVTVIDGELKV
ncbi:PhzF family phenazine biosynthesis protein [Kribbella catacumbae]|uniref:PhzF family phenazine biosynthesis protein n=1 Tax=Kribbella catacumbae TaxID=460086 RepID=UPI000378F53C|nr:PhzF family phenazine biosynthesis protein [Kribbella catacumbae]